MNHNLKNIILTVRRSLKSDQNGIIIGELGEKNLMINNDNSILEEYFDFLRECDGARCGSIDFWSFKELSLHQYRIVNLATEGKCWIEIGQILYEPLVINKIDGKVYRFYQNQSIDKRECFGDFDNFLLNYVFGEKYSQIVPDTHDDDWYQFLRKLDLI